MSHHRGGLFVIAEEKPQQCDSCGGIGELRPYGPGGSTVCFGCAMNDPEGTGRRFAELSGPGEVPGPVREAP